MDAPIKSLLAEDLGERFLNRTSLLPHLGFARSRSETHACRRQVSGRMERRLPVIVVVRLALAERAGTDGEERTYTDNISAHGARVFSRRPWQLGDKVRVTPVNEESTVRGKVVYCHRLADDRYGIGVQFRDRPCHVVRRAQI